MAIPWYLAMSESEVANVEKLPQQLAWLGCRFSPGDQVITGLPEMLPPDSLLVVTDQDPPEEHDIHQIVDRLSIAVNRLSCAGILLDFQTPDHAGSQTVTRELSTVLPCPVAVSELYAKDRSCPVFLSPCPHHVPLAEHIAPWKGRELWLDLAADAESITLTKDGAFISPLSIKKCPQQGHWEPRLHCHYCMEIRQDFARFTLWRTREDLETLAREAKELGIHSLVGLYQELHDNSPIP